MSKEYPGSICGGPSPFEMKACYGGCYEWCIHPLCSKTPDELTDKERRRIRRFQKRCGGFYLSDLRELSDFDVSPPMLAVLRELDELTGCKGTMVKAADYGKRQVAALLRRDLIWQVDGEIHISGEGGYVVELSPKAEPA